MGRAKGKYKQRAKGFASSQCKQIALKDISDDVKSSTDYKRNYLVMEYALLEYIKNLQRGFNFNKLNTIK